MDALIFDFDGVVVDSEPVHFRGFRHVLGEVGIVLTEEEYYTHYLGYDDHDCFLAVAADRGVEFGDEQLRRLIEDKTGFVQREFTERIEALPGAAELIAEAAAAGIPLAICSGALREEIVLAARTVGVLEHFQAIVPAEDVHKGKPDPEGYLLARQRLERQTARALAPERCVVVEDSPAGISAAKGAGMRVLAVLTSYPAEELQAADRIVGQLSKVALADLAALL